MDRKAIGKMGTVFARHLPKMYSRDNLERIFSVVQIPAGKIFPPFHNRGPNMDSLQH